MALTLKSLSLRLTVAAALVTATPSVVLAQTAAPAAPAPAVVTNAPPAYVLGYGDSLDISVVGNEALTLRDVPIRPDGRVSLGLVGEMPAGGQTIEQLTVALRRAYVRFVTNPQVVVNVSQFRPVEVTVVGLVGKPGAYPASRPIPLLKALAMAGGLVPERADYHHVQVITAQGVPSTVDLGPVFEGKSTETPLLQDGDTVTVPEVFGPDMNRIWPVVPGVMALLSTLAILLLRK